MTDSQPPTAQPYGSVPPVPPASGGHGIPGYSAPQVPQYPSPPGAYTAPVGGYGPSADGYQAPQPAAKSAVLGIVSFVLSIVAAVVAPIIAGVAGYQIGFGLPSVMEYVDATTSDLSFLAPVRDQVLIAEIGFWTGTLAGIAAIVLGIIAIARRQGRVWGVVALVIGALAPVIFFIVLSIALGVGASAGAVLYYGA